MAAPRKPAAKRPASTPFAAPDAVSEDGRRAAHAFVERVRAGQAGENELADLVSPMYGLRLRGFCQALQCALMREGGA